MGPSSFQWYPVTGQGAMGTNWSTGSSVWTWGRTSSLWGWRSTGPVCPGRLWSLLLWRYSRPAWTRSCAACCRRPFFGRGVGLDDPQRSLPTPTILWFCDSETLSQPSSTWKGAYKKSEEGFFAKACSNRTRASGFKLKEDRFKWDLRKKFFTRWVVKHWNTLPREALEDSFLAVFKVRLDGALSNLV